MENDLMKASNFFESISTYQVKIRRILDQANERQLLSEGENQTFFDLYGLEGNRFKSLNELRREQGLTTSGIQKKVNDTWKKLSCFPETEKMRRCLSNLLRSMPDSVRWQPKL